MKILKRRLAVIVSLLLMCVVFGFTGCDDNKEELQRQIEALQTQLAEQTELITRLQEEILEEKEKSDKLQDEFNDAQEKLKDLQNDLKNSESEKIFLLNELLNVCKATNTTYGTFFSFEDACNSGFFSTEFIKNVSYYYQEAVYEVGEAGNNYENWTEVEFQPTIKEPVLDFEKESKIKIAGAIEHKADFSEERIVNFYGEYNGYYVVTLENFYGYGTAVMPVVVNGLGFWLGGPYLEVFKFDS